MPFTSYKSLIKSAADRVGSMSTVKKVFQSKDKRSTAFSNRKISQKQAENLTKEVAEELGQDISGYTEGSSKLSKKIVRSAQESEKKPIAQKKRIYGSGIVGKAGAFLFGGTTKREMNKQQIMEKRRNQFRAEGKQKDVQRSAFTPKQKTQNPQAQKPQKKLSMDVETGLKSGMQARTNQDAVARDPFGEIQ